MTQKIALFSSLDYCTVSLALSRMMFHEYNCMSE